MTTVEEFFCYRDPELFQKGVDLLELRWNKRLEVQGDSLEK